MKKNKNKLVSTAIKDLEYTRVAKEFSFKQLGDYLIQNFWHKEVWGTLNVCVLDRVINELFKLQELCDIVDKNKPNKNIKVPSYDKLSEGCSLKKCK